MSMKKRDEALQALCRSYLYRLRYVADKHGLGCWLRAVIRANKRKECEGTRREVYLLSRAVDDERISRGDVPSLLGLSYRRCCAAGVFGNIKKIKARGSYSKADALLLKEKKGCSYGEE